VHHSRRHPVPAAGRAERLRNGGVMKQNNIILMAAVGVLAAMALVDAAANALCPNTRTSQLL
jgi:hypothetical protein